MNTNEQTTMSSSSNKSRSSRGLELTKRRCWNCRDRKVACDLDFPECRNCTLSNFKCQGYGLRLSWPSDKDFRRTILGKTRSRYRKSEAGSETFQFINASSWDVELHNSLITLNSDKIRTSRLLAIPLSVAMLRSPNRLTGQEQDLVSYFITVVSKSLTSIRVDAEWLCSILFKLSFADDSFSSTAVLHALLALSSLYLYGHTQEAVRLKVAALSALNASMKRLAGPKEAQQHIAVGMLLCAFEVFLPSETSFQWPLYVSGAKRMLCAIDHYIPAIETDTELLLLWMYYHDVLGRFTSRHWPHQTAEQVAITRRHKFALDNIALIPRGKVLGVLGCSMEMLDLISQMSSYSHRRRRGARVLSEQYDSLDTLESELSSLRQDTDYSGTMGSPQEAHKVAQIAELYRLAALVYLERVLRNISRPSERVNNWLSHSFTIISQLESCERPFPLFIIGCQARTDDQRSKILAILSRTQKESSQRNMDCVQRMIESIWIQSDLQLDSGGEIDYPHVLDAVMGSCEVHPSLA
ncbi:fungal-specific transcription factor domain-protein [Lipomyces doorenjongii]